MSTSTPEQDVALANAELERLPTLTPQELIALAQFWCSYYLNDDTDLGPVCAILDVLFELERRYA